MNPLDFPEDISDSAELEGEYESMVCCCGCFGIYKVPKFMLHSVVFGRVKAEYCPLGYGKQYDTFYVTGSTGDTYKEHKCLVRFNEGSAI